MQVTETLRDGLKRGYTITVTAAELDEKVTAKLAEAQPEIAMKGFRKGKVPMALLRKQYGQRLMGEAMQESVDGAMSGHFAESGDRPAGQPEVKMIADDWKEGDDVVVEMSYEALPEIPEPDLKAISLERLVVKADEAEVAEALGKLAENAQSFEKRRKGSKAKDGDQVVIDFVGSVDGEEFEGGKGEDYPLVLGSNSFIPGFEDQLIGAKQDEEVTVTVTFPEEYGAKHLAGKEASFACTVKEVRAPKAAEIDDEMAKQFGAEDLDALKAQIAERLEAEFKGAARAVMKRALLDALDDTVAFELPPSLVEAEAAQIAHQLWHEEHPEVQGHDHETIEPTDEHKALAARRVKLGLLLAELGTRNEIQVTDSEMTQAVMMQARQYPGHEQEFFQFVQQNPQMQQQLRAPIFEDKVVDYIIELAQVSEREVSRADLEAAIEKLEDDA